MTEGMKHIYDEGIEYEKSQGGKATQTQMEGDQERECKGELLSSYLRRARNYPGRVIPKHLARCDMCKEVFDTRILKRHSKTCMLEKRQRYIYLSSSKIY